MRLALPIADGSPQTKYRILESILQPMHIYDLLQIVVMDFSQSTNSILTRGVPEPFQPLQLSYYTSTPPSCPNGFSLRVIVHVTLERDIGEKRVPRASKPSNLTNDRMIMKDAYFTAQIVLKRLVSTIETF